MILTTQLFSFFSTISMHCIVHMIVKFKDWGLTYLVGPYQVCLKPEVLFHGSAQFKPGRQKVEAVRSVVKIIFKYTECLKLVNNMRDLPLNK